MLTVPNALVASALDYNDVPVRIDLAGCKAESHSTLSKVFSGNAGTLGELALPCSDVAIRVPPDNLAAALPPGKESSLCRVRRDP